MFYLNVILTAKNAADVPAICDLLKQQRDHSLKEPGCLRFEVYHSTADETRFVLNEHWESAAAVEAHRHGHAYTTIYQPKVLPLVTRESHPSNLL